MNNEFNNQDMNQIQSNNVDNQYVNNYNNLNNQNNNKSGNNGLIAILVIIIVALAGLCLYLFMDKKDSNVDSNKENNIHENGNNNEQQDSNKENNKMDEYIDSDEVKIEINKKLQSISLVLIEIMDTYGIYDFNEVTKLNNLFENDMSKFEFTKYVMAYKMDDENLVNWDLYDEDDNFYNKCDGGTGAVSIEETIFNEYYKKLLGIDFDKTKINVNAAKFIDGYICTSMATGYMAGNIPVLKTISKAYNASSDTYKIEMTLLGSVLDAEKYGEPEILEWPSEKEKAKLTLTYKINNDNSYQIVSFIVNPK